MILMFHFIILIISLLSFVKCSFNHNFMERNHPVRMNPTVNLINLKSTDYPGYRLPTNLKPTEYQLLINASLDKATFKGQANITLDVINATNMIVLNVRFESISADSLKPNVSQSKPPVAVTNITVDKDHQMVWLHLNDTLQKQSGVLLTISYDGLLASDNMGFYLSTYNKTDERGIPTEHRMAITQFEGTFARRAFPCFDEPAYRANFTISIIRSSNQTSMSNMELDYYQNISSDWILDVYKTSPEMPTYLVAFGVSDFTWISDEGSVRVAARPDVIKDAQLALTAAQPILYSIGNFTNVSYPLKKMDIVAVPDFKAGAMENWGLTTYREKDSLFSLQKNTQMDMFLVFSVIAHEFAHQWFGDLVTPQWWDYTWLNEAFATYFEYTTPNQMHPEWNIGSTLFVSDLQDALNEDSEASSPRPMTSPVFTPDQIESIFDYVIYNKGGSVLRMIENFLTTEVWKNGLYRYLKNNAYKTGTPNELFSALEAAAYAANSSVASKVVETLTSWTTLPGYPLVKLQKEAGVEYLITQSPCPYTNSTHGLRWNIPLTYTTQEYAEFDASKASRMLMSNTSEIVTIKTSGWIILNVDQIGYFRVNYDEDNWYKIIDQLKSGHLVIGSINRAQLLDDACKLSKASQLNYTICMDLTRYLTKETEYAPWNSFFKNMQFLVNQFYNTSTGDGLMQYIRNITASPFQSTLSILKNSKVTFMDSITYQLLWKHSCSMHLPDCENITASLFQKWTQDPYSIPVEIKEAVICTQLRMDSTGKSFQTVLNYTLTSDNEYERITFYSAMGCASDEGAINRFLDVISDVNANHVRLQNRVFAVKAVLSQQSGVNPGLQYLTNNYDRISRALDSGFDSIFVTLGNTISQEGHIVQVRRLLNDTKVDQRLKKKLETVVLPLIQKRQAWAQSSQATQLKNWIQNNTSPATSSNVGRQLSILMLTFSIALHLQF